MASIASPTFYRKFPIETVDANIWGLRDLLDFYLDKELKGFLFFLVVKYMVILMKIIFLHMRIIEVLFLVLVPEHVMTKLRDLERHYAVFSEILMICP